MATFNSDLLPPIFDQVLLHFAETATGPGTREDIVNALLNAIVNVAAENVRESFREPEDRAYPGGRSQHGETYPQLQTSDRLSGSSLSRARLVQQIQATVPLKYSTLETALLLIESQIDLRLSRGRSLELREIQFHIADDYGPSLASWCQSVLPSTLHGASVDRGTWLKLLGRHRPEGVRLLIEGLQLSATLREAVPYRITVPDRLIDPLITARERDGRIRLLHVSDFHLVEDIREPGSTKWRPFGVPTHSYETVRNLARVVRNLSPGYDLALVTGDLTTDGSREAFETARQFIQSGSLSGGKSMRIATFGLSAGVGRRILLPGNHDRFGNKLLAGQCRSSVFEEMLDTPKGYPYVVGFRPPNWDSKALTILFFVFDSNLHEVPRFTDAPGRLHSIAQGIVESEEIDRAFNELAKEVAVSGQVKGLRGEKLEIDIDNTVRVAVLHHHPFISAEEEREARKGLSPWRHPVKSFKKARGKYDAFLVEMKNSEAFLRGCFRAGIQLILFGHQHDPYYRPVCRVGSVSKMTTHFGEMPSVIHGFCCASALEHTEQENGFYVLDFFENRQLVVDYYSSKRNNKGQSGEFLRVAEKSKVLDLSIQEVDMTDATLVRIEADRAAMAASEHLPRENLTIINEGSQ